MKHNHYQWSSSFVFQFSSIFEHSVQIYFTVVILLGNKIVECAFKCFLVFSVLIYAAVYLTINEC